MWYESLLEHNFLPDRLIRLGIRYLLTQKLRQEEQRYKANAQEEKKKFVEMLSKSPIAINTRDANEQHYEVPARFFQYVMGKHMKYSSGYWPEGIETLDGSEEAMLALTIQRAQIRDGQTVLDLGCGWGSLSLYLAEKFPNARIVGVSNSTTQRSFIEEQAVQRKISNLSILTADINSFHPSFSFDRIVSVEMFEHMRNYELLLKHISRWLKKDGLLFVHVFCHTRYPYLFEESDGNGEESWITRYFFSGGTMPSVDLFSHFSEKMEISQQWIIDGKHYQKTLEAWLVKFDANKEAVLKILSDIYGAAEAKKRFYSWRIFFMACAEMMGYGDGNEWVVGHYLFKPTPEFPVLSAP